MLVRDGRFNPSPTICDAVHGEKLRDWEVNGRERRRDERRGKLPYGTNTCSMWPLSSTGSFGVWLGSTLRELESLGVGGKHWDTLGDVGRHKQRVSERAGVVRSHWETLDWKTLGVVEVVVVYFPTNHLAIPHRTEISYVARARVRRTIGCR